MIDAFHLKLTLYILYISKFNVRVMCDIDKSNNFGHLVVYITCYVEQRNAHT